MNIIALYLDRPGYCMEPIVSFLRQQGHSVWWTRLQMGGLSARVQQLRASSQSRFSDYDVAITPEPLCALGLRLRRIAKRQIFWRIDYRPSRYIYATSVLYRLATGVDEVWSIVPDPRYRYVPFLLDPEEIREAQSSRKSRVVWMGPDYSGSGHEPLEAVATLEGVSVSVVSWKVEASLTDQALDDLLLGSKIGLALYELSGGEKCYSDPGRVKKFLAAGLAVVTDDSYPFAWELEEGGAGICLEAPVSPEAVREAVSYCLRDDVWSTMSASALLLAKKYVVSREWLGL